MSGEKSTMLEEVPLLRAVELPQVVDAGVGLRVGMGFQVRNRNGREQSDEPTTIMISTSVNPPKLTFVRVVFIFSQRGVNHRQAGIIITKKVFTDCLLEPLFD